MTRLILPRVTISADSVGVVLAFAGVHRCSQRTHYAVRTHDDYRHAETQLWARLPHDEVLDAVDALADAWEVYVDEAQAVVESLMAVTS